MDSLKMRDNIGFGNPLIVHSVLDGQVCVGREWSFLVPEGVVAPTHTLVELCVPVDAPHDAKQMKWDDRYFIKVVVDESPTLLHDPVCRL